LLEEEFFSNVLAKVAAISVFVLAYWPSPVIK
jgi:hypothetical protein